MDVERVLGAPFNEGEAFTRFIEAMRVAEESARQLALLRDQKEWIGVEATLARSREIATLLARRGIRARH